MAPTTEAELEAMTYRELQGACKEAGVKASGKKDELVARLLESTASQEASEPAAVAPAAPEPIGEEAQEQGAEEQQPQQQEGEPAVEEKAAAPSPVAAAAPVEAEPEPTVAQEAVAPEPAAADAGKRKAEGEAAEAPSLKHLKSPGVILTRRTLPTSGIKPPAIFASKPVPSPVPFPVAAAAAATATAKPASMGSARKSVACSTTTSHRASMLPKKPIATGPTPFGPGTYGSGNTKAAAPTAATASAKAALLKERPKLNYKPHVGPLRPFFSPKPLLAKPQANGQQHQQRKPLGAMGNVNNRAGSPLGAGVVKPGGAPVMAKPHQQQAPAAAKQVL